MITMTRVQLNVAGYEFYGQAELPQQAKHNASTQVLLFVQGGRGWESSQYPPIYELIFKISNFIYA